MAEQWLQAIVQEFGKRLGLSQFRLNDKGAAGVSFENGVTFRMEYRGDRLFLCLATPMQKNSTALKALLQLSHPAARRNDLDIHAAYQPTSQRAIIMTNFQDRTLSVPLLDKTFTNLWELTHKLHNLNA